MVSPRVSIIDFKIGNLFSVLKACEYVGINATITNDKNEILNSDAIILPGVGAFSTAMENLERLDLVDAIVLFAQSGKPLMGICLGMQLLLTDSEEFGFTKGLGLIKGTCKQFPTKTQKFNLKVPQINWNRIVTDKEVFSVNTPLKDIKNGDDMYFVHSYYADCVSEEDTLSFSEYGDIRYVSSVHKKNIFGFQFHPEKSGKSGIKIYKNFKNLI